MRKYLTFIVVALLSTGLSGCGDNKTKKKLIGTQVVTGGSGNLGSSSGMSSAIARSANVGAMACGSVPSGLAQAYRVASRVPSASGLTGPDSDGYFSVGYSFSNTTVKIRFQKADGSAILNYQSAEMAALAKLRIKITTKYDFGIFNGDFLILYAGLTATTETMESGTITTADPVGGTFTATISNMVVERTTINSIPIGIPISGSMTIAGNAGGAAYTGTNTYSKSGADYKCEGPINVSGAKVADVYLTFNNITGNYTGYWVDAATAEQHPIQ